MKEVYSIGISLSDATCPSILCRLRPLLPAGDIPQSLPDRINKHNSPACYHLTAPLFDRLCIELESLAQKPTLENPGNVISNRNGRPVVATYGIDDVLLENTKISMRIYLAGILLLSLAIFSSCAPNPAKPLVKGRSGLYEVKEVIEISPNGDSVLCNNCGEMLFIMQDKSLGEHESTVWVMSRHPALDFLSGWGNNNYWNFSIDGDKVNMDVIVSGSVNFETLTYQVDDLGATTQNWTSSSGDHALVLESKDFE